MDNLKDKTFIVQLGVCVLGIGDTFKDAIRDMEDFGFSIDIDDINEIHKNSQVKTELLNDGDCTMMDFSEAFKSNYIDEYGRLKV